MGEKLNINDLKYIAPAVLYNWRIEQWTNRSGKQAWYWDGDPLFPVKVGKRMEKLVSHGLMKRIDVGISCYVATEKALSFHCPKCHKGRVYNDSDEDIGACPVCNGVGLITKNKEAV